MKCAECKNEHGVTVLQTIKAGREALEVKYSGGMVTMPDDRVLCWYCAFPTTGAHL